MRRAIAPSTPARTPASATTWTVLAVTLLAFALRLWRLDALGDLEFDEIVSVRYASLAPANLLPALSGAVFEHPPLYYLTLGGWLALAGVKPVTADGDLLARVLSVFSGTLLVPLSYAAGARLLGRSAGAIAAALLALGPLPLFYSRDARMYGLVACLAVGSSWLFGRAVERGSTTRWLAFTLIAVGSALVHFAGLILVLVQPLAYVTRGNQRALRPAIAAIGVVAVAALAWAASATGVRESLPAFNLLNLRSVPAGLWQVWRELAGGPETDGWRTAVAAVALLALAALGVWRRAVGLRPVLVSLSAGLLAVVFAIALGKPVQARYVLVAVPFVYLLVGAALAHRAPAARALAATALLVGALPWAVPYYGGYRRADYGDITRRIATHERPGDAILLTGPWQAWYFDYYYPRSGGSILHQVLPRNVPPALDPRRAAVELADIAGSRRRVWFVQSGLAQADPTNFVERWLLRNAWPALREARQNAVLSLFTLHPPDVLRPLRTADFGDAVRLTGGWVDGEDVAATDVVRLQLEFEPLRASAAPLRVSLRLVGTDGQRLTTDFDLADVDRDDRPVTEWRPGERIRLRRGVWVPVSANPQPYDVRLVVYEGATLAPLAPSGLAFGDGGEVSVGAVYVTQTRAQQPPPDGTYERVDRTFGGGDEFDALRLTGVRWHQPNPSIDVLSFDLLWQLVGASDTRHHTVLTVRDAHGRVASEVRRPLFSGSFSARDWRPGETLGERRVVDATALPPGDYVLFARLEDDRGRRLPVAVGAPASEVELRRFQIPYGRHYGERVAGLMSSAARRVSLLLSLP
ncbi:MAG: glycosyltransferase family 39 protein [Chloroflexota bacterium]